MAPFTAAQSDKGCRKDRGKLVFALESDYAFPPWQARVTGITKNQLSFCGAIFGFSRGDRLFVSVFALVTYRFSQSADSERKINVGVQNTGQNRHRSLVAAGNPKKAAETRRPSGIYAEEFGYLRAMEHLH